VGSLLGICEYILSLRMTIRMGVIYVFEYGHDAADSVVVRTIVDCTARNFLQIPNHTDVKRIYLSLDVYGPPIVDCSRMSKANDT